MRLMTISTKPMASRPRRGRIRFQTSGQTAFSLWIFGGFGASLSGELNLLFDSAGPRSASFLLPALSHRSGFSAGRRACDTRPAAVVCSGRVPPVFVGPITDYWPCSGLGDYLVGGTGVFGVYDLAGRGTSQAADRSCRSQP